MLIWAMLEDTALSEPFRAAMSDPEADHVSAVSVWDVAVKRALGKLVGPVDLFDQAAASGFLALPITCCHACTVEALPPQHADPFDRMLIAQVRVDGLTLLSADRAFAAYDVALL